GLSRQISAFGRSPRPTLAGALRHVAQAGAPSLPCPRSARPTRLPLIPGGETTQAARLCPTVGVGVTTPGGITFGSDEQMLGQGGQPFAAERAGIDRGGQILSGSDLPPSRLRLGHPRRMAQPSASVAW